MTETQPTTDTARDFVVALAPGYEDRGTAALWVHKDMVQARKDWEVEAHIRPPQGTEAFGDVASWATYVKRYSGPTDLGWEPVITWNAAGLHAILDPHQSIDEPGRCQWLATCPFVYSTEWRAWQQLANGHAKSQRELVEALEDLAEDIREPDAARLMELLRSLRANVQTTATTSLQPDGSTSVAWGQDKTLIGNKPGALDLPGLLSIALPVLKGDPQPYQVLVRLRVTIGDDSKLTFRLSLVNAERVLEAVYADRVEQAAGALGDGFNLLRAADA